MGEDESAYTCEACGESFETREELTEHVREVGLAQ